MIAAFVVIAGNSDSAAIVHTPVAGLYPGSVVGMLKSIVFEEPTTPLTCACSCVLSDETASVPSDTSIAWRNDKVAPTLVLSEVVFTVIVARSWRSSSTSTDSLFLRRNFGAGRDRSMASVERTMVQSFWRFRLRKNGSMAGTSWSIGEGMSGPWNPGPSFWTTQNRNDD